MRRRGAAAAAAEGAELQLFDIGGEGSVDGRASEKEQEALEEAFRLAAPKAVSTKGKEKPRWADADDEDDADQSLALWLEAAAAGALSDVPKEERERERAREREREREKKGLKQKLQMSSAPVL